MKKLYNWLKKYFVPHQGNNFKPHFLRHESFTVVFLTIIIIELGFLVQVFLVFDKTKFLAAVLPGVLTTLTNEGRVENNLTPLTENNLLAKAAQMKAEDMASKGYFAHTSPEGKTPWYWFAQVNYRYASAGENLAVNFFESEDVARAWMNSPSHRANIVKKDFTEIGIGVASGVYEGRDTVFVAQLFGTPLPIAKAETIPPPISTAVTPATTPKEVKKIPPPVAPRVVKVLGEETIKKVTPPVTQALPKESPKQSTIKSIEISVGKALTSPRQSVAYVYGGIAILILISLLFALFVRFEMSHPWMLLRGLSLFTVVILLLFVNIRVLDLKTQVSTSDEISPNGLNANVLEAASETFLE